ncbi:unnamed protein product [Prorocentrum cordatum]|uniref:Anoctamin transmembrane domain-containing protein n=1 Tax=Prorocentrum cordatum TaxID=2364126 RepID=A0ABN9X8C7_9DINO|nr:unnamed protein product [Polarella glacialis]
MTVTKAAQPADFATLRRQRDSKRKAIGAKKGKAEGKAEAKGVAVAGGTSACGNRRTQELQLMEAVATRTLLLDEERAALCRDQKFALEAPLKKRKRADERDGLDWTIDQHDKAGAVDRKKAKDENTDLLRPPQASNQWPFSRMLHRLGGACEDMECRDALLKQIADWGDKKELTDMATCSAVTICFVTCMVCFITLGFLILRQQFDKKVHGGAMYFEFCLALYVEVMNYMLSALAGGLTARENHRTEGEHEFHMLAKTMVMKFVITYFALYYIAFFKDHHYLFGVPMTCLRGDCFSDLQSQLAAFVFFRLVMANAVEFLYPRVAGAVRSGMQRSPGFCVFLRKCVCDCGHCLENWIRFRSVGGSLGELSATEAQANLDCFSAFEEFEEFMICHGLATLFAATSPWVCFVWLLGAILEMKVDRDNLLLRSQRPTPARARNNEPWDTAFELYGFAAATTNILLAVFVSEEHAGLDTLGKLEAFTYYAHAVLLARLALAWLLPVVPRGVATLKMKQDALVHRVLENVRVQDVQERGLFRDLKTSPLDIHEFDFTEEDEDGVEPSLRLGQSARALASGILDAASAPR